MTSHQLIVIIVYKMAPAFSRVEKCALAATILCLITESEKKKQRRERSMWTRAWISRRIERGAFQLVFNELRLEDPLSFKNYLRMTEQSFMHLLSLVEPKISKESTTMRDSIPAAHRLALTLRFLASGNSYKDLQYNTRIPQCTISSIIPEVCDAIFDALKEKYLKVCAMKYNSRLTAADSVYILQTPQTQDDWKRIAVQFQRKWQFPGCIGALDGKHVVFTPSKEYGSMFYNYKGTHSIVLLALVDANYNFIYIDVGVNGRVSDGGVYRASSLRKGIEENKLNIPESVVVNIKNKNCVMPYTIVADDAFPLGEHVMKRYPMKGLDKAKRIYNYRLSRARRVVENAFGIVSTRFRVLLSTIKLRDPEKIEKIVLACCALHNFLNYGKDHSYIGKGALDLEGYNGNFRVGSWRNEVSNDYNLRNQKGNHTALFYRKVRDNLKNYFIHNDPLPWQEQVILPVRNK
jgi:hypothetical protein